MFKFFSKHNYICYLFEMLNIITKQFENKFEKFEKFLNFFLNFLKI